MILIDVSWRNLGSGFNLAIFIYFESLIAREEPVTEHHTHKCEHFILGLSLLDRILFAQNKLIQNLDLFFRGECDIGQQVSWKHSLNDGDWSRGLSWHGGHIPVSNFMILLHWTKRHDFSSASAGLTEHQTDRGKQIKMTGVTYQIGDWVTETHTSHWVHGDVIYDACRWKELIWMEASWGSWWMFISHCW